MAKTLAELKKQADLLELEAYQIRGFGKLTSIQTWEDAIAYHHEKLWENGELQTEFACLINHPMLTEGELVYPPQNFVYTEFDSRGLPKAMRNLETGEQIVLKSFPNSTEEI